MQQRLPLAASAEEVARLTILLHLPHMTADCFPALDLPAIFVTHTPAHVIAAVPLEPSTRIVRMDPAFALPFRQRLTRIHAEKIARTIAAARRKPGGGEPAFRKFPATVGHVFAAKYNKFKQLRRRQLRLEFRIEATPDRCAQYVAIALLHPVGDNDRPLAHARN